MQRPISYQALSQNHIIKYSLHIFNTGQKIAPSANYTPGLRI